MIDADTGSSRSEGRSGPGEHLARAVAAGHASFRLPIDWACAEPAEGRYDESVFEGYASVCRAGRARGLEPVVVIHHVGLPRWLGADFWLHLDAPARFGAWTAVLVDRLGDNCRRSITLVEPNDVAWREWITGGLPPYRVGAVGDLVRALDHMLAAHVAACAAVHRSQPDAAAAVEIRPVAVYELDGLLLDVLTARADGVGRHDLRPWLTERRRDWYDSRPPPGAGAWVLRRLARSAIPVEQAFPRTVAAVFDAPHEGPVD
ncbi:MAG: family 1 glycosylhydrolase [Actinobacteria bacterium]|nr:family 1 glycosylhydrolase [Actinomycetota bacterium]